MLHASKSDAGASIRVQARALTAVVAWQSLKVWPHSLMQIFGKLRYAEHVSYLRRGETQKTHPPKQSMTI